MSDAEPRSAEDLWQDALFAAGYDYAEVCARLRDDNPMALDALGHSLAYLATELWDRGFSQTEIREAFTEAVTLLVPYAAGEERRGD
ncbi:MAG TPA: hypothetical protein VG839_07530 [Asticcacaulis sp.]|nr:hypothetical protein [Asticcacaulis sp.]